LPQTRRVIIEPTHVAEPAQPTPSNLLRITGSIETPDERMRRVVRTIRSRCFGVLSEADLDLVLGHRRERVAEARRTTERDA
jgi:hypothetical protein